MLARILSAIVLVPAVLAGVYFARPWPLLIALGIIGTLCLYEYFQMVRAMGIPTQPVFGFSAYWALLIGLQGRWIPVPALLVALLIAAFLAAAWREDPLRDRALGLMAGIVGLIYPALFLFAAVPLRFDFGDKTGLHWFMVVLAVTWTGDTMALFTGRRFGRTAFAPMISPKKTNEGAIGGLIGGLIAAAFMQRFLFADLPFGHVLVFSLLVGAFGQLGDLAESTLKRAAGVKDSSHLIPGHGGVLDRVDSLLFAFPVAYIYLLILHRS